MTATKPEPTGMTTIPLPLAVRGLEQGQYDMLEKFRDELQENLPMLVATLPVGVRIESLTAAALLAATDNPDLLKCEPLSLVRAVLKAGLLGLRIGETCDIVPTKKGKRDVAECWTRVKGTVELAIRSRAIRWAREGYVCEGDEFTHEETDSGTKFLHRARATPAPDGSNVTDVYAIITLMDGTRVFERWTKARILAHRDKYAKNLMYEGRPNMKSPWHKDPLPMWAKTVVKAGLRFSPLSPELRDAMNAGDEVEGSYEIIDDPAKALQAGASALAALSSGADADGAVKDASDGLTLTEALEMVLPGTAENFKGYGGKALKDARVALLDVETWYHGLTPAKQQKYARLNAAVQMVAQDTDDGDDFRVD